MATYSADSTCPNEFQCHEDEGTARKLASGTDESWGPATKLTYSLLKSRAFVEFISKLTGIDSLLVDPNDIGGGIHLTQVSHNSLLLVCQNGWSVDTRQYRH